MTAAALAAVTEDERRFAALSGVPKVDFRSNLQAAIQAGRKVNPILGELFRLRRGPGRLSINEYFYYRLWASELSAEAKARFVGKQAQHPMHIACNDINWYAAAADKVLFHTLMTGAGVTMPVLLAMTDPSRHAPGARALGSPAEVAAFLREPSHYPLFAKPVDGKFSLGVVSADAYDAESDQVLLLGGERISPEALGETLATRKAGFLLQRRLAADAGLAALFGPRLWSVRVLLLLTPQGPRIHRALAKIATGQNPADNMWRTGNMVAAIDLESGHILRAVRGTGAEMVVNPDHPDTGRPLVGTLIPGWDRLAAIACDAARLLPGIRTQSWDIALTDEGPVPLEVNFGGDLNLSQLAYGEGVLDDEYRAHLRGCGYKI